MSLPAAAHQAWLGLEHPDVGAERDNEPDLTAAQDEEDSMSDESASVASLDSDVVEAPPRTGASVPVPAPTGELTLAAMWAPQVPWTRRFLLLGAALAVNIGLPFINGVMLGFGEIFARAFLAPWIGLASPLPIRTWSAAPSDVAPLPSVPRGGVWSWWQRSPAPAPAP